MCCVLKFHVLDVFTCTGHGKAAAKIGLRYKIIKTTRNP